MASFILITFWKSVKAGGAVGAIHFAGAPLGGNADLERDTSDGDVTTLLDRDDSDAWERDE